MKYIIRRSGSLEELEDAVNGSIAAGFVPIGGVQVSSISWEDLRKGGTLTATDYYQAMIRPAQKETP